MKMGIITAGLLLASMIDIRWMIVPIPLPLGMAVCGIAIRFMEGTLFQLETIPGLIPGLCMMAGAKISRENIGTGDAWMMIALGTMLDFQDVTGVAFWAFWAAGILALFLFLILKRREMEIPFVPFLFLGYAINTVLG